MPRITRTGAALGALVIAAFGLAACSSAGEQPAATEQGPEIETLVVATGAQPRPYTFLDENDELTGYDIELLRLVDEKLDGIAFDFQVAEFPALFAGLDSGRFDIVANNLSATDERREKYDFSVPYIEGQFGIITKEGAGEIVSLDELAGKKTYGEPGLNFTRVLEAYNEQNPDKQVEIEYTELDLQTQYNNLATGAIDFLFNERVVFQGYGGSADLGLEFHELDGAYLSDSFGTNLYSAYAVTKAKDRSAQLAEIDAVLEELLADGTASELSKKFFDGLDVTPRS
ncbi:MAG: hypothetical protein D3X82_14505 [Candidatus Leucobacter sulfamidivorax]|nr:hypothetical protein [Candidatus Leucobacter sulfamidivorax]